MNSMISSKLLAAAMCAVALVGCNAVEDVREAPFTPVPPQGVVLQGKVTGSLGNKRSITLINNGDANGAISASYTLGTDFTPFTFGVVPAGSPYDITVKANPFGKICTVSGGSGVITTADALNVVINCVNDPSVTRYAVRVAIPAAFASSAGAKVTLTTEEGIFEKTPAPGDTFVQFDSAVFHNVVGGVINAPTFTWVVSASNTEGSTVAQPVVNKCLVTNSTNPGGAAASPTANIGFTPGGTAPVVGTWTGTTVNPADPCGFTIGGAVSYSTPPSGGGAQAMPAGGLDVDLRDVKGTVIETKTYSGAYGGTYTFNTVGRSNPASVFDVVVSRQPTGQYCVVGNGGAATLGVATANITNANIVCRAIPAAGNRLRGTYGFYEGMTFNYPTTPATGAPGTTNVVAANGTLTTTVVTVITRKTWTTYLSTTNPGLGGESRGQNIETAFDTRTVISTTPPGGSATVVSDVLVPGTGTSTNNSTTRNFLTFFEDGTFLAGAHGATAGFSQTNQIEHGFYTWDGTGTITFSIVTDTIPGGNTALLNTALSGMANTTAAASATTSVPTAFVTMTNVVRDKVGDRARLSGRFAVGGAYGSTTTIGARWSNWVMLEPINTVGQTEGTWVTQDHRQTWSYDNNTTLGYHVGVNGGAANLQDACFTYEDFRASGGYYTRKGGLSGCLEGLAGVVPLDIPSAGVGTPNNLGQLPGLIARIPGSETAFDGRSPSPIIYALGTKDTLAAIADPDFFPPADITPAALAWCASEIYALRSSLNGLPINVPVYMCRERSNTP